MQFAPPSARDNARTSSSLEHELEKSESEATLPYLSSGGEDRDSNTIVIKNRAWRKLDLRVLSILVMFYLLSFLVSSPLILIGSLQFLLQS